MHRKDSGKLFIVMYHYVRDLERTRYPKIKGLHIRNFRKQLDFLGKHYKFVRMEECISAIESGTSIPDNAVLLTFDDGYLEHFTEVFPILDERGIQGSFFPPVQSSVERKVLDVNKIHFILASVDQPKRLLEDLKVKINNYKSEYDLHAPQDYFNRVGQNEHPYDPYEIVLFKRVLQRELPEKARSGIIADLFYQYVSVKEEVFANELYMNESHLKLMIRKGMFVGGHGYSHQWLHTLGDEELENEIRYTKDFLTSLGINAGGFSMCYPYGAYNDSVITKLEKYHFSVGLSTKPEVSVLNKSNRYELGRIDTNEIMPLISK